MLLSNTRSAKIISTYYCLLIRVCIYVVICLDITYHGVQGKMIAVDNFFVFFEIFIFCFVVAICDLVHAVEATYDLP